MKIEFFDFLDICIAIYLDDLSIFSLTSEEYQRALYTVFSYLAMHLLYLRPDKCALLLKCMEFLGYILDASDVYILQSKIDAITECPKPCSIIVLQ